MVSAAASVAYPPPDPIGVTQVLFRLIGANMNSTADQAFTRVRTFSSYTITGIRAVNASTSLTLAAGGIYDTAAKGGVPLVAASQVFSGLTGSTIGIDLTPAAAALGVRGSANLFLSLTAAQGAAATADVYITGIPLA